MGNFCTRCGRPLAEGEICNCTPQAPPPVSPQPVKKPAGSGVGALVEALKVIFKNPEEAIRLLSGEASMPTPFILIPAQAVISGFFALATLAVAKPLGRLSIPSLAIAYFITFFCSVALSAGMMGLVLAFGKMLKGNVNIKTALAITATRSFFVIPFCFVGIFFGMANIYFGALFFLLGEILALLATFMAAQKQLGLSVNKSFILAACVFAILLVVFIIILLLYTNAAHGGLFSSHRSSLGGLSSLFD